MAYLCIPLCLFAFFGTLSYKEVETEKARASVRVVETQLKLEQEKTKQLELLKAAK